MAIDPSIPLGVRPQPFNNPFEQLENLRVAQQRRQLVQQQIDSNKALEMERRQDYAKQQRAEMDDETWRRTIRETADLPFDQVRAAIAKNSPEKLAALDKSKADLDEKAEQGRKAKAEYAKHQQEYLGHALDHINQSGGDPVVINQELNLASEHFPDFKPKADELRELAKTQGREAFLKTISAFVPADVAKQRADAAVQSGFTLGPGQSRFNPQGESIASVPLAEKPDVEAKAGTFEDYVSRYASELGRTVKQLSPIDIRKAKAEYEAAGRAPKEDAEDKTLVAIMGADGKPVLVRRSQAEGKTPATTREQGRQVTSGDAGRIAELDTSLNDIEALAEKIGKTGAGSKIGAMLPNVVSEYTGWGVDSKSRQATIDRVKQVIGKALEGGVLRKEDETKYEKILPTIGDPPEVAKTKLAGLFAAIEKRRQTTIDALKDANYDVVKFEKRVRPAKPPTDDELQKKADELKKKYGY